MVSSASVSNPCLDLVAFHLCEIFSYIPPPLINILVREDKNKPGKVFFSKLRVMPPSSPQPTLLENLTDDAIVLFNVTKISPINLYLSNLYVT